MEHIWTMLMHKILQNHLLCAFVADLKIDAIYALYPESFCDKNLAIRKVFAFCDSGGEDAENRLLFNQPLIYPLLRCSSVFNRRHHTPQQHSSSISQSLVYLWVWVEKEKPQICVHIQCLSLTQVGLGCK